MRFAEGPGVGQLYDTDEAAELAGGLDASVAAAKSAAAARAAAAAERLRKLQELEEGSAYGELYPGCGGFAGDLRGSDDDEEAPAAGSGRAGAPAGTHKGKGKAGRAGDQSDAAAAEKARDAKLSTQLQDIRRAIAEKHGEKHEGAFAKRECGGDAERAAEPLGGDAADVKARAKRLRL